MKSAGSLIAVAITAALLGAFAMSQFRAKPSEEPELGPGPSSAKSADAAQTSVSEVTALESSGESSSAGLPPMTDETSISGPGPGGSRMLPRASVPGALERSVFEGNSVSMRALELLKSKDFDGYLGKLQSESNAASLKQMSEYREQIDAGLAELAKGTQVNRMACGVSLCIASVYAEEDSTFGQWYKNAQSTARLPMPVLMKETVPRAGGGVEHRLLFVTNPALASFRGGPAVPKG